MSDDHNGDPRSRGEVRGGWILAVMASSRLFVLFAVLGTFLSAVTLYVYGTFVVFETIWDTITKRSVDVDGAKHLQVVFIELSDVFLLGTVLIIVAFGLYQLFIERELPVPAWLRIEDLNQLTTKLIEVIGTLLGVTFLAYVVEIGGEVDVLRFGISVAVVIAALGFLLLISHHLHRSNLTSQTD